MAPGLCDEVQTPCQRSFRVSDSSPDAVRPEVTPDSTELRVGTCTSLVPGEALGYLPDDVRCRVCAVPLSPPSPPATPSLALAVGGSSVPCEACALARHGGVLGALTSQTLPALGTSPLPSLKAACVAHREGERTSQDAGHHG